MRKAAESGAPGPPADLRYLRKSRLGRSRDVELLADVTGFLHRVYGSIAETLPDVRDGTLEDSEIQELTTDPYIKARPRKFFRSVSLRERNLHDFFRLDQ